jgi:hypothetical protein
MLDLVLVSIEGGEDRFVLDLRIDGERWACGVSRDTVRLSGSGMIRLLHFDEDFERVWGAIPGTLRTSAVWYEVLRWARAVFDGQDVPTPQHLQLQVD